MFLSRKNIQLSKNNILSKDNIKQYMYDIEHKIQKTCNIIEQNMFCSEYPHLLSYDELTSIKKSFSFNSNIEPKTISEKAEFIRYNQSKEFYEAYPELIPTNIYNNMTRDPVKFCKILDYLYFDSDISKKMFSEIEELGIVNETFSWCKTIFELYNASDFLSANLRAAKEVAAKLKACNCELEDENKSLREENQNLRSKINQTSSTEKFKQNIGRSNSI